MSTAIGRLELPNPIMTASGCAASGRELARFFDVSKAGAIVTKSVLLRPHAGRPTPRMAETPSGLLNAIGLQGPGVDVFLQRDLPWLLSRGARAVVSIAGSGDDEYAELATRLSEAPGVGAIEINLSVPNAAARGREFACDARAASAVVQAVRSRARYDVPVIAKLSSDVTDIVAVARACADAGADGLTMINTPRGMTIDTATLRPVPAGGAGGLSGPAIRPIAVDCVFRVYEALPELPIIGVGGVTSGHDALEMVLAGARAVQVGTAIFTDPAAPLRILRELEEALEGHGIDRLSDAVGLAHRPPGTVGVMRLGESRRRVDFDDRF